MSKTVAPGDSVSPFVDLETFGAAHTPNLTQLTDSVNCFIIWLRVQSQRPFFVAYRLFNLFNFDFIWLYLQLFFFGLLVGHFLGGSNPYYPLK